MGTSATAEDRLALAADLQDVIAHRVTAIEVQTAAARRLLESSPETAAAALQAVLRLGHETMGELRRLGRLLDQGTRVAMAPAPTLASVEAIVGGPVEIGDQEVPGGVAVCAFRVVELLARRGGLEGGVSVHLRPGVLRIESVRVLGPADEERLRVLARPCGGRYSWPASGRCRVDLPLAP